MSDRDPSRRDVLRGARDGLLIVIGAAAATAGFLKLEDLTIRRVTIAELTGMSDAQKRALVDSGTLLGIQDVGVRVTATTTREVPSTFITPRGPIGTTREVTAVRYQLSDRSGATLSAYADDSSAGLQIPPDDENVKGAESFGLVTGSLAYNPPGSSDGDSVVPTGFYFSL